MSSTKSPIQKKTSNSEKTNHNKMFGGFQARTIRSFWEQHNQQEIEIQPEVLSKLAEDATYRVWEIVNSIKNYSKHSGGIATYDITNDVLKDANCEPIIGANCAPWQRIENDGFFFFNEDETVSTREEYRKEVSLNENGPLSLNVSWLLDDKIGEDYIAFYNQLIEAIFLGDSECCQFALNILSGSPHITGLLIHFLKKWIDMIAFDYTDHILDRSLRFLEALVRNPCSTVNNEMNTELKYLCQLLVNLLVGPEKEENFDSTESFNFNDQQMASNDLNLNIKKEADYDQDMHHLNNLSEIDIYLNSQMMLLDNLKKDEICQNDSHLDDLNNFDQYEICDETSRDYSKKEESDCDLMNQFSFILSKKICDDKFVDQVCNVLGLCSSKWSGVESLCTFILVNRVENYFTTNKRVASEKDYDWLQRIIRGLWCLGERAFRELLIYFEKIDTQSVLCPSSFSNYLNFSGIFIRGKCDIFFYEYIHDAVGDKILPFTLYYADFLLRLDRKYYKIHKKSANSPLTYKYPQKISLYEFVDTEKAVKDSQKVIAAHKEAFPDQKFIDKNAPTFHFRFSGCRQVYVKKTATKFVQEQPKKNTFVQDPELLKRFNQTIVIARKKLIKPATNVIPYRRLINYHHLNL